MTSNGWFSFLITVISIHIPLARYDLKQVGRFLNKQLFQSTYRSRGMTGAASGETLLTNISIHIPLARYDQPRLAVGHLEVISIHIPLARYDLYFEGYDNDPRISIHIPLARYDVDAVQIQRLYILFQSTYRSRGMTLTSKSTFTIRLFQSTYRSRGMTADKKLN